jgi:hypothetical protein
MLKGKYIMNSHLIEEKEEKEGTRAYLMKKGDYS